VVGRLSTNLAESGFLIIDIQAESSLIE